MLVAYAAVSGGIDLPAVLGYASGIAWTLIYDTIYAHQVLPPVQVSLSYAFNRIRKTI